MGREKRFSSAASGQKAAARLGDKDDTYWISVKLVTPAAESDAPDFMTVDPQGKFSPEPSPQFVAWAKAHTLSPDSAAADSLYVLPGRVMLLGSTGDTRAIPLIIEACKRHLPTGFCLRLMPTVYYDDSVFRAFPRNVFLTNSDSWLVIIPVPYLGNFR